MINKQFKFEDAETLISPRKAQCGEISKAVSRLKVFQQAKSILFRLIVFIVESLCTLDFGSHSIGTESDSCKLDRV